MEKFLSVRQSWKEKEFTSEKIEQLLNYNS
jgi:hypothetical protein